MFLNKYIYLSYSYQYSICIVSPVKALQAGQSSQGTSEPITPVFQSERILQLNTLQTNSPFCFELNSDFVTYILCIFHAKLYARIINIYKFQLDHYSFYSYQLFTEHIIKLAFIINTSHLFYLYNIYLYKTNSVYELKAIYTIHVSMVSEKNDMRPSTDCVTTRYSEIAHADRPHTVSPEFTKILPIEVSHFLRRTVGTNHEIKH